jgi:hypothetical protein
MFEQPTGGEASAASGWDVATDDVDLTSESHDDQHDCATDSHGDPFKGVAARVPDSGHRMLKTDEMGTPHA